MSKLEQFQTTLEREIVDPSPALRAYVDAGRAHLVNAHDVEIDFDTWKATCDALSAAWMALTSDERAYVNAFARSTLGAPQCSSTT